MGTENRICATCKTDLPLDSEFFSRERKNPGGFSYHCKPCQRAKNKAYRDSAAGKRKRMDSRFKRIYDISVEDYEGLLELQDGKCAICRGGCTAGRMLAVDHNHRTGEVRGLLCSRCNTSIGKFEDSPFLLRRAADYLEGVAVAA